MSVRECGQYHYEDKNGSCWTFMWQPILEGWSAQQVLMSVRNNCVSATNSTQNWFDTLHAIGETKMYSITMPKGKNVDEIAAHWIAGLLKIGKLKYYRALIIVKARPSEAKDKIIFSCYAAMQNELIRMTVKMEARFKPEKPAPIWTVKDTTIDILDSGAASNERSRDPAINLLHDCLSQLAHWHPFGIGGAIR